MQCRSSGFDSRVVLAQIQRGRHVPSRRRPIWSDLFARYLVDSVIGSQKAKSDVLRRRRDLSDEHEDWSSSPAMRTRFRTIFSGEHL
ncbi:hypothetical protein L484_015218 [Morus notabilis]|uniref:Uncharacterized protein n=1 Tax=Morus notabilis TaxID=981085 RepID=W9S362_9ROSA|nr:hypothetical protein L484_015218 [Morus notabilis]